MTKKKSGLGAGEEDFLKVYFEDHSVPSSTPNPAPESKLKVKDNKVSQPSTSALVICRNKYVQLCRS
jgi:hypothetical protein